MIVFKPLLLLALLVCPSWSIFNTTLAPSSCLSDRLNRVKTRQDPVRGANLGSWLILESWMVGWLWNDNGCNANQFPGSYLLEQCLGGRAASVMRQHWSTFVTESDFALMASLNLNAVRFPIGWWQIYDPQGGASNARLNQYITPTNYLVGGLEWIDKALDWGAKYGVGVLLGVLKP